MKKLISLLLVLCMVFAMTGCGSKENEGGGETPADNPEEKTSYKAGISMFVMDAGMTALTGLMKDTLDNADIEIETFVTSADSSMSKQNSDIEDLVTKGCDIIWVQGFDSDAITGALKYAYERGVIVAISTTANCDDYTYLFQVSEPDTTGRMQAQWFVDNYLSKNPDHVYKVALCNGSMATAGGAGRRDGVFYGLQESGYTNYEIVVEQDCDYITENAQAWAEGLMTSHPEVDVIFCGNDDMALGVANAIEGVGRTGEIVVLGTDGQDVGMTLLDEGKMQCTIRMNVMAIGKGMAGSMISALKGELDLSGGKVIYGDPNQIYAVLDTNNYKDFAQ